MVLAVSIFLLVANNTSQMVIEGKSFAEVNDVAKSPMSLSDDTWDTQLEAHGTTVNNHNGTYTYTSSVGESNAWNGTHWVRYMYDAESKQVQIGNLTFTHGTNGVISINHTGSGFAIERLKWYAQYYLNDAWQNFTFDNYEFVGVSKTEDTITATQRWWSTNGELQVSYTYTYWGELKMRAWATNWASISVPVRIIWAAQGIQTTGMDYSLIWNNNTGVLINVGVAIGNDQQLFWHDVIKSTPQYAINTVVDKPNRRAAVIFGNQSSVLAQYETMDIDPTYTVGSDANDDEWYSDTHYINRDANYCYKQVTTPHYGQFRVALPIAKDATINSAYATVYVIDYHTSSTVYINRIDETNVGALEADSSKPDVSGTGQLNNDEVFRAAGYRDTGSMVAMVQEQVDLAGWQSGYYMGIQFRGGYTGVVSFEDYQHDDNHPASMTVTFTIPPTPPTNDGTPTIATLDDSDNLYSRYRKYEVTTYHNDVNGYADIDYVQFYMYSNDRGTNYWYGRFDEDSQEFTEEGGTGTYWELDTVGSSFSANGDNLDVTWKFYIEWTHPDVVDCDVRAYVIDESVTSDSDYYEVNWDIETDLTYDTTPVVTDDDAGTVDRGDLDEAFTIAGNVGYEGSTLTPPSSDIDTWVYVTAGGYGTTVGPWEDDTVGATGDISVACYADNAVGEETYEIRVVDEGAGYTGTDLVTGTDPTDTYIVDRVYVWLFTAGAPRTDVGDMMVISFQLWYEYDDTYVTDGTVTLEGESAQFISGALWQIQEQYFTVTQEVYDTVTYSGGTHGLTGVDMNGKSRTLTWDQVQVQSYSVSDSRDSVYDSVNIDVTLWYDYDNTLVVDGTVTINTYGASHQGSGVWRITRSSSTPQLINYNTVAVSGGEYFLTAVDQNSQSVDVIWDRIQVQSYSVTDNRVDLDANVNIDVLLWYDYDNTLLTTGTVTINGYSASHQGSGVWRITRTSATVAGITYQTIVVAGNTYDITYVHENGQSQLVIWDQIRIVSWDYGGDARVDINTMVYFEVELHYDYDETDVTDGTVGYDITAGPVVHQGSGFWEDSWDAFGNAGAASWTEVTASGNTHGITVVDDAVVDVVIIWDQIVVVDYTIVTPSGDDRNNINTVYYIDVELQYDWNNEYLTDGTVTVNGISASYQGSSLWRFEKESATVGDFTFDTVATSGNEHGITVVDQNSQSLEVIWDRIQVQSYSTSDARDNINDNVNIDATLWYDYDNTQVTDGTVTINGYSASHQGSGVWRITRTSTSVTMIDYDTVAGSGNTHGITAVDQNSQNQEVIWDRVLVYAYATTDARDNINDNVNIDFRVWYEYDSTNVLDGDFTLNVYDSAPLSDGWWRITKTSASVTMVDYDTVAVTGANEHGITAITQNGQNQEIIWDQIEVYYSNVIDARDNVGDQNYPMFRLQLKYDNHLLDDGTNDAIWIESAVATWYGAGEYWYKFYTESTVGLWNYVVTSASENTYGITAFDSASATTYDVDIIWDRVQVTLSTNMTWTVIDYNILVTYEAIYQYDSTTMGGTVEWNIPIGTLTKSTTGTLTWFPVSISETTYDITVYVNNTVSCVFDDAEVSAITYDWFQQDINNVWLIVVSGTWTWIVNTTTLDSGTDELCVLQSKMNATGSMVDDDWGIIDATGQIGDLIVGSFGMDAYYADVRINCETTISGRFYNWEIWSTVVNVDILHSIHIEDSGMNIQDNWITFYFHTNWGNATFYVWDGDNLIGGSLEGWYQVAKPTSTGLHNFTILVNGTQDVIALGEQNKDFSSSDAWEWRNFKYTVNPVTLSITDLLVQQNNDSIILSGWFHTPELTMTWEAFEHEISVDTGSITVSASGDYYAIYWQKNTPLLLRNWTLIITADGSTLTIRGYSYVLDTASYLSTSTAGVFYEGDSITNVFEGDPTDTAFWFTMQTILLILAIPVIMGIAYFAAMAKKGRKKRGSDRINDIVRTPTIAGRSK